MTARKPGRFLAPLALVAVIVATLLVVRAGTGTTHHAVTPSAGRLPVSQRVIARKAFYVVRPGDSLSAISAKTGVPVARLEALNPAVDPGALQSGHRLRLRP